MTPAARGALLGLLLGVGLVLVLRRVPAARRIDLDARLAPYLRDTVRPSRLLGRGGVRSPTGVRLLLAPVLRGAGQRVEHLLGGTASVRRRLTRSGRAPDVEAFRVEQVLWGVGGLVLGAGAAALAWWRGSASPIALTTLVLVCGATGVVARDWWLSQRVARRERRVLAQFPAVAELLALSVGAGEGPLAALDRVCRLSRGELADELRRTLADVRAGAPLTRALQSLADRTGLPPLARFVDGLVVAMERGTPLADVLRAQAQDVREAGQRALMDTAGKKEIAMMVPVVFLVLPVTVLFAVYPGFAFLRLGL